MCRTLEFFSSGLGNRSFSAPGCSIITYPLLWPQLIFWQAQICQTNSHETTVVWQNTELGMTATLLCLYRESCKVYANHDKEPGDLFNVKNDWSALTEATSLANYFLSSYGCRTETTSSIADVFPPYPRPCFQALWECPWRLEWMECKLEAILPLQSCYYHRKILDLSVTPRSWQLYLAECFRILVLEIHWDRF